MLVWERSRAGDVQGRRRRRTEREPSLESEPAIIRSNQQHTKKDSPRQTVARARRARAVLKTAMKK